MVSDKVKVLIFDSYMAMIKNSVGTGMFRNFYARVEGRKKDILRNGDLSCAIYLSTVLVIFRLIKGTHATVASTIKDMEESGWEKIKRPRVGCVLLWEDERGKDKEKHKHIGFYVGDKRAISNNSKSGISKKHHWTYGTKNKKPKRKIIAIYWNNKLKN